MAMPELLQLAELDWSYTPAPPRAGWTQGLPVASPLCSSTAETMDVTGQPRTRSIPIHQWMAQVRNGRINAC